MGEDERGSFGDAEKRLFGDVGLDAKHPLEELINVADLGAATRDNNAFFHNVGDELGRGIVEDILSGGGNIHEVGIQGFGDFIGIDYDIFWQAGDEVATASLHFELLAGGEGGADLDFDSFGGLLANRERIFSFNKIDNRLIKFVSGDA